jgi:hypothetical protein
MGMIRAGMYKEAAEYAQQLYRGFKIDPSLDDSKLRMPRHERAGYFDMPTNEEGIRSWAEQQKEWELHGTPGLGRTVQAGIKRSLVPWFGGPKVVQEAAEHVSRGAPRAAKDFFMGAFGDPEVPVRDVPVGEQIAEAGSGMAMTLVPFVGATKGLSALPWLKKLGAAGTRLAATKQASATLGAAGGMTEAGRQLTTHISRELGQTTMDPDYAEVPLAAVSFAAGGVPTNRVFAGILQGMASVGSQAAASAIGLKEDVDWGRVGTEVGFATLFGNPQFKTLRNKAVKMTPELTVKLEEAHNTKYPKTRAQQLYKEGEVGLGQYVEGLSKRSMKQLEAMQQEATARGDEPALRAIRDTIAEKNGDIVVTPKGVPTAEVPSGPKPKKPPKPQRAKLNQIDTVKHAIWEHPDGINVFDISDKVGLTPIQVRRAIRHLDNPGGLGEGSGVLGRTGPGEGKYQRYALIPKEQRGYKAPEVDVQKPLMEETSRQLEEAGRKVEDETLPEPVRKAAKAQVVRLSEMMDNLPTEVRLEGLNEKAAKKLAAEMLEGRTKGEIESWLKDASKLPDELKKFRQAITEVSGSLFRSFPEDGILQAQADSIAKHVVDDSVRVIYKDDIPKDIDSLRNIGAMWQFEVHPQGEGKYRVKRRGRVRLDKAPIEEVYKLINTVARGVAIKDPRYSMDTINAVARNKGWGVKTIGNGQVQAMNEATQETVIHTYDEMVDFVNNLPENFDVTMHRLQQSSEVTPKIEENPALIEQPIPDNQIVQEAPLRDEVPGTGVKIAGTNVTLLDDAGTSQLIPPGWADDPQPPKKGEVARGAPDVIKKGITPIPALLDTYSDLTGLPLGKTWRDVHTQVSKKDFWQRPYDERLSKIHAKIPMYRQHAVHQLLMAEDMADAAVRFQADSNEYKAALHMRDFYKDLFDMDNKELSRFLHVGLPKIREVGGDLSKLKDYTLPGGMAKVLDDAATGELRLHDDNALAVARDLVHAVGNGKFMSEIMVDARVRQRELIGKALSDPPNSDLYTGASNVLKTYLDSVGGRSPDDAYALANAFQQYSGALKKLGFIGGDELQPRDVERLLRMSTSWYGGISMSWRAALVIRNLAQSTLSLPKVGTRYAFQGVKDAINAGKEGRAELAKAGIINEPAMFSFITRPAMQLGQGWVQGTGPTSHQISRIEKGLRTLQSFGLGAYRRADQFNRAATYFAGKRALKGSWQKHAAKGDAPMSAAARDNFLVDSGLAGDSHAFQREIFGMLSKGQVEEASVEYGKHVSRMTQYLYSKPNVPRWFQGVKGRIFGQFGVWPMGFHSYVTGQAGGYQGLAMGPALLAERAARGMLSPFGATQRARTASSRYKEKFYNRLIGQGLAVSILGGILGIDTSSWNKSNLLAFEGGPGFQMLRDSLTLVMQAETPFDRAMAWSQLKRTALQYPNPAGAFTKDVEDSLKAAAEGKDMQAIMELLGFNTTDPWVMELMQ